MISLKPTGITGDITGNMILDKILKVSAKTLLSIEEHGNNDLTKTRMSICNSCDRFDPEHQQCGVCGCYMDVKTTLLTHRNPKAFGRIEITHCPIGKWGDLPEIVVEKLGEKGIELEGATDMDIADYYRKIDSKPLIQ